MSEKPKQCAACGSLRVWAENIPTSTLSPEACARIGLSPEGQPAVDLCEPCAKKASGAGP